MDDFKRRTKLRMILYSPLTAGVLLATLFFIGHATIKMAQKYIETKKNYEAAVGEFEELKKREKNIEDRIVALKSERGVEDEIRSKFGFIKEGEEVVIIVEPPVSILVPDDEKGRGVQIKKMFESITRTFKQLFIQ